MFCSTFLSYYNGDLNIPQPLLLANSITTTCLGLFHHFLDTLVHSCTLLFTLVHSYLLMYTLVHEYMSIYDCIRVNVGVSMHTNVNMSACECTWVNASVVMHIHSCTLFNTHAHPSPLMFTSTPSCYYSILLHHWYYAFFMYTIVAYSCNTSLAS